MKEHDIRGLSTITKVVIYSILAIFALSIVVPLFYMVITSFASTQDYYTRGFFIIPHQWSLQGYEYLMSNKTFVNSFKNSVIITSVGTLINITVTALMAYAL